MPTIPKLPAALVAVLGVIASVLAAVQPSLPDPWPAIVSGLLALLTLVGVPATYLAVRTHGRASRLHSAQQEPSTWRRNDGGMSRVGLLAAAAAVLLVGALTAVVLMSPAQAAPAHRGRPATVTEHIAAHSAWACDGTLVLIYDTERLAGSTWQAVQDDGAVTLQIHDASGRWGTTGEWLDEATVSGGEAHLRWAGYAAASAGGVHADLARAVRHGIASVAVPITEGCQPA